MSKALTAAGAASVEPRLRLWDRLRRGFFRSFFKLVILVLGFAQWTCLWRMIRWTGIELEPWVHGLAPLGFYALNRGLVACRAVGSFRGHPWLAAAFRGYAALAFTSLFCTIFLLLTWGLVGLAAPLLPAAAKSGVSLLQDVGMATVAVGLAFGYSLGQRQLEVSRLTVAVENLPEAFEGYRILQVSDIHIGEHMGLAELAAHVESINAMAPDLICVTGDIVDRPETCDRAFPTFSGLRARDGVCVTLGNHDFMAGAEVVTDALRRWTPFSVLRDSVFTVRRGGASLHVVGVDDLGLDWTRGVREHPALVRLHAKVPPGEPWIVLSHRPDCFPQAAGYGAALMLSGHTHGGQLGLPRLRGRRWLNLARFITAFDRGEFQIAGSTLYVNRGLGFTAQRVRLFCSREITIVELTRAESRQRCEVLETIGPERMPS